MTITTSTHQNVILKEVFDFKDIIDLVDLTFQTRLLNLEYEIFV